MIWFMVAIPGFWLSLTQNVLSPKYEKNRVGPMALTRSTRIPLDSVAVLFPPKVGFFLVVAENAVVEVASFPSPSFVFWA